jgi:hypothetical protein
MLENLTFKNQKYLNENHFLILHIHEKNQKYEHNTIFFISNVIFKWTQYNKSTILGNASNFIRDKTLLPNMIN